jgi:hypothetical protein
MKPENNKKLQLITLIIIIIAGIIIGIGICGFSTINWVEEDYKIYENNLKEKDNNIINLQKQITTLQENSKYKTEQLKKTRINKEELQELFNELFIDATSCYWAITCEDYPTVCVEHFKETITGWTSQEIRQYQTQRCEEIEKNWDKYYNNDTSIKGE